jgi:hypothetical protein
MPSDENLQKLLTLAQRLMALTEGSNIRWNVTDIDDHFTTVLTRGSISISRLGPESGAYRLAVANDSGATLEEVVVEEEITYGMNDPRFELVDILPDLYDLARRQALNVEGALDSILDELS